MDIKAFDKMNYGLYIVSTKSGDQTAGCVVNTLTQATVQPARLLVTIHKDNQTERLIEESGAAGIWTNLPTGRIRRMKTPYLTSLNKLWPDIPAGWWASWMQAPTWYFWEKYRRLKCSRKKMQ